MISLQIFPFCNQSNSFIGTTQKPVDGNVKNICQSGQLKICHITNLTFQFRKTGSIHIHTIDLQLSKQLLLLHSLVFSR